MELFGVIWSALNVSMHWNAVPVLRKGFIGLTIEELIKYNLE
jgi:hypothetical protein